MKKVIIGFLTVIARMLMSALLLAILIVVEIIAELPRIIKYLVYALISMASIKYLFDGNIVIPAEVSQFLGDYFAQFRGDTLTAYFTVTFLFASVLFEPEARLIYRRNQFNNWIESYIRPVNK